MDKIIFRFLKHFLIGFLLIVLEFYVYSNFTLFAKQQLVIYLVAFYLSILSYQDETKEYLFQNQILAICLGITYGLTATVSSVLMVVFFVFIVTYITLFTSRGANYIMFINLLVMYLIFFTVRIFYFEYALNTKFDFYDLYIKNFILVGLFNSVIAYVLVLTNKKIKKS